MYIRTDERDSDVAWLKMFQKWKSWVSPRGPRAAIIARLTNGLVIACFESLGPSSFPPSYSRLSGVKPPLPRTVLRSHPRAYYLLLLDNS